MRPVAKIRSDFHQKFGIPRQPGLVEGLEAHIVFEPEFRTLDIVRGLTDFSHIWLIWHFSESEQSTWSATVRPPGLKGERTGVFASRSPHRPNPLGLSSVRLHSVESHPTLGPVLAVGGADLLDGTPIFDIKPYVPSDVHTDADFSWTGKLRQKLQIEFPEQLLHKIPENKRHALIGILAEDPRPHHQNEPEREFGVSFAGHNVRFRVAESILTVFEVEDFSALPTDTEDGLD